jgi:hypothetical protein
VGLSMPKPHGEGLPSISSAPLNSGGDVCRMHGWKVRNEQDARGKLAQIFTHPLRSRCGIARLYLARDLRHAGARTGVVVRPQTS